MGGGLRGARSRPSAATFGDFDDKCRRLSFGGSSAAGRERALEHLEGQRELHACKDNTSGHLFPALRPRRRARAASRWAAVAAQCRSVSLESTVALLRQILNYDPVHAVGAPSGSNKCRQHSWQHLWPSRRLVTHHHSTTCYLEVTRVACPPHRPSGAPRSRCCRPLRPPPRAPPCTLRAEPPTC